MSDHPALDMGDIFTGTGLIAYLDNNRKHLVTGYDALQEMAAQLRAAIRNSGNTRLPGMNQRVVARQITRPVQYAADLHLEAAKGLSTAGSRFRQYFLANETGGRGSGRTFDPNS